MVRTQISLTKEQHAYLKELARRRGQSLSELVREAVDRLRAQSPSPVERAVSLIGAFEADRTDVSEHHDDYFPEDP